MKSAWELALEKTGGEIKEVPQEKKELLQKIDVECKAKLAEISIAYDTKFKQAQSPAELEQLKDDLAVEKASVLSKAENEKQKIRSEA